MLMRMNPLMESEAMDQALVAYENVREERIKSNKERMQQLGILNLSHDVNGASSGSNSKKRKRNEKKKVDLPPPRCSSREMSSSSEDMDFDIANESEDANNSGEMDLDLANESEGTNNLGDDSGAACSKKRTRGATMLLKLGAKGALPNVQFDEFGRAIGENAATFDNWIGLLARIKIDITIEKWPKFPETEKEKLWKYVKVMWAIPNDNPKVFSMWAILIYRSTISRGISKRYLHYINSWADNTIKNLRK